jgi:dipeptidyl aminopeptidase/acylaminoacyl peptidase
MPHALLLALFLAAPVLADDTPQQRGGRPPRPTGVYRDRVTPNWFAGDSKFWYRNDLKGGTKEFILVDAEKGTRGPAFDHAKLAAGLAKASGTEQKADKLPSEEIEFVEDGKAVAFDAVGRRWKCDLTTYDCTDTGPAKKKSEAQEREDPTPALLGDDPPLFTEFQQPRRPFPSEDREVKSPDGQWVAFIRDHNVFLRPGGGGDAVPLSKDGTSGKAFGMPNWSPDSKTLVAFHTEPGDGKEVHLLESSPPGGGRARLSSRPYPLPGDKFAAYEPWVFDVVKRTGVKAEVDKIDFGRPRVRWHTDGRHFTYEKVDRGHQRFRLVEVDAHSGKSRTLIDEKSDTFIWTNHYEGFNFPNVTWLGKTDEIIYVSEKSGWRHLYLIDAKTGKETNAITSGEYVVRGVDQIDEEKRQVWFRASGKNAGEDPYFVHAYRVNFDGTGLTALTDGNGSHTVQFSPTRQYLVDTYSRVDLPPVTELRRVDDGKRVCQLEEADVADLKANGWTPPEVFTAKGRDDKTDIWGIIVRPRGFDPAKRYPVIESIYAGPQGSFVPKAFSATSRYAALSDLGFVVVQIDGMGTANRSKAFHDVCWKNLKDAGFPDRVRWHKAVATKYPWYDISRVGIYGTSAGGQNAMGALLFHGDFYKAAMAACGCHDNRMDKASWNEQWMGYPVGPQYAASSNVDNAHKLTGKLLLIVGEMDSNVPPESTFRVVDALVKANKDFDLLVVPGMGHSNGGPYGVRRMQDFFVKHLQGVEPPDRNKTGRGVER